MSASGPTGAALSTASAKTPAATIGQPAQPVSERKAPAAVAAINSHASKLPHSLLGAVAGCAGLSLALTVWMRFRSQGRSNRKATGKGDSSSAAAAGPCAKLKPTPRCVPLADGSACIIRREIAADNSCLFNSIGYAMHKSKTRAPHLRNVVAQQVSGDRTTYSDVFLGMTNEAYCHWIRQPYNWGGGIELAILAQAYGIEIAAWNIESCKEHVFGEESGYKRQVMVIYNGVHYDALAVCSGPRANPDDDETSYNPRTKRGKMIIAAARKLVELAHKESLFHGASKKHMGPPAASNGPSSSSTTAATTATTPSATKSKANGMTSTAAAVSGTGSGTGSVSSLSKSALPNGRAKTSAEGNTNANAKAVDGQRRIVRGAPIVSGAATTAAAAAPTSAAAPDTGGASPPLSAAKPPSMPGSSVTITGPEVGGVEARAAGGADAEPSAGDTAEVWSGSGDSKLGCTDDMEVLAAEHAKATGHVNVEKSEEMA